MDNKFFSILIILLITTINLITSAIYDEDLFRRIDEFITSRGFINENHTVTTKDEYKLSVNRMINPFAGLALGVNRLEPVLLVHGVLGSGIIWLYNEPNGRVRPWPQNNHRPNVTDNSLGFLLSNNGFDVWIISVRGTSYSRSHVHLDPDKDQSYWDFTFTNVAEYDISATIDYILKFTKKERLTYIGYSQGSTFMFTLLSMEPKYMDKLNLFIAIAPAAYLNEVGGVPSIMPADYGIYHNIGLVNCEYKFYSQMRPISSMCNLPFFKSMCLLIETSTDNPTNYNQSRVAIYINNYDSTSCKTIVHGFQLIKSGQFQHFNYSLEQNLIKYNSIEPPKIDLSKISGDKIILISSTGDEASTPNEVDKLKKSIKSKPYKHFLIDDRNWTHLSFVKSPTFYSTIGQHIVRFIDDALDSNRN